MSRPSRPNPWRRSPAGAAASRRLLRWPARNYFAELEPGIKEGHPVDNLMAKDPDLRRIRRRARRHLARLQVQAGSDAVLGFEAERNHLDSARVEAAYNLGFEGGLVAGRIEGRERADRAQRDPADAKLLRQLRTAVDAAAAPATRVQVTLLELAWALALGSPLPGPGRPRLAEHGGRQGRKRPRARRIGGRRRR